jgi:hypothetical protein
MHIPRDITGDWKAIELLREHVEKSMACVHEELQRPGSADRTRQRELLLAASSAFETWRSAIVPHLMIPRP